MFVIISKNSDGAMIVDCDEVRLKGEWMLLIKDNSVIGELQLNSVAGYVKEEALPIPKGLDTNEQPGRPNRHFRGLK